MAPFAVGLVAGLAAGYASRQRRGTENHAAEATDTVESVETVTETIGGPNVLDVLETGVCVVDGANIIDYANTTAQSLGLTAGQHLATEVLVALAEQARTTGTTRQTETELQAGDRTAAMRVVMTPAADGYVITELRDISEQRRIEKVRHDFVANVGHELKTPVGALQLLAEALADAVDDSQAAARFTNRIQHESARMSRLVSELLELSRLQGAEPVPRPVPVNVDRIITEAFDRSGTAASTKNMSLRHTGSLRVRVSGNEDQLITAVSNLVDNAVVYSPADTAVTVNVTKTGPWVRIAVTDEGIGIAPNDAARIFERFYRADPARSRATGGTGLGLAIVKHIAGNHGGGVEVTSSVGNGATFTLTLPYAETLTSDTTSQAPQRRAVQQ